MAVVCYSSGILAVSRMISRSRNGERGITILLVAIAMISILAMAALAVDIVALYVARAETQRAADAAALAAAKMFVFSGYTSNSSIISQTQLCATVTGTASTAAANQAAQSALSQNPVVGQVATIQAITCDFSQAENPRVAVTVQRTNLPTFFARIWRATAGSVSATASAEAFNPSGGSVNIAVGSVKPWLVANDCPGGGCSGPFYFTASYGIANPSLIGQSQPFTLMEARLDQTASGASQFYALDPPQPNYCPSTSAVSCTNVGTGPGIFYHDNIACSNTAFQYSCGQQIGPGQAVTVDTRSLGTLQVRTQAGTECLVHASSASQINSGQDIFSAGTTPVIITGGYNNPNLALQGVTNISRSDSVVTVPVYNGADLGCSNSGCTNTATVIGFLQLGIQDVYPSGGTVAMDAVILNASGCDPGNTGTPVTGGALSPVPVRLIQ
jgi:hypothetical protein